MKPMKVPFVNLALQNELLEPQLTDCLKEVIRSGTLILGEVVETFEQRFAELCGCRYAVSVNSGTDALILALKALGVGPGDEVITVPNSFVATVSSIQACGATPVFVDVRNDLTMDSQCVAEVLSARTKVILPVHLTGRPVEMSQLYDIAEGNNIAIVEDAAQAVGASWKGRMVGSLGTIGCFSLHPLKILGALGDGGVITINDAAIHEKLKGLRNFGLTTRDTVAFWGTNSRLDSLQAAFLMKKMEKLDEWIARRREIARRYREKLRATVIVPEEDGNLGAVYQTFVIQVEDRDALAAYLSKKGVDSKVHYPIPLHKQPSIAGRYKGNAVFPNTERLAEKILSLPMYPELTDDNVDYVIDCIGEFYGESSVC